MTAHRFQMYIGDPILLLYHVYIYILLTVLSALYVLLTKYTRIQYLAIYISRLSSLVDN